nr:flocculation protein FLO11-like [Rhipicephalus microplus]
MHSPRPFPDARSPIAASPSAESTPVPAPTSEDPTRRPFCHRRSESLPTNKVQAHRYLFFEKIATDSIQAVVEKWLQTNPVAPTEAPMLASQCASGAALATSGDCATRTAEELPQSPMQTEATGQTQGPAGVPLPLSSDEDNEAMDFSNSRKRLREEIGDEDDHAPRMQMATTPSESSEEESHTSRGSEELSGSMCRTTVDSEVASTTADMTSSATTGGTDSTSSDGAGTCQLPTTASTDDLLAPGDPCPPSPHTKGLPLPATSPQAVERTLPAPAAERPPNLPTTHPLTLQLPWRW